MVTGVSGGSERARVQPQVPIEGPSVWRGAALERSDAWQRRWRASDLDGFDAALERAARLGLSRDDLSDRDFPLPEATRARLREMGRTLEEGCGVIRVTGLPVGRYSETEIETLFSGICRHLGTPVYQDPQRQRIRKICDEGSGVGERYGALEAADGTFLSSRARTASTGPLRFHTDRADVVALLCVRQARSGGSSLLASSPAVHNEMLRRRPDLLELLYQPYVRSRLGEELGGEHLTYALPIFGQREGKFTSHYSRTYIEAAQLLPGIPRMSDAQWEALDVLADTAQALCMEMRLEPGDIQLLNNHVVYHARTAFENDAKPNRGRLLYRVWLSVADNRPLPPGHEVLWREIEAGRVRGGIAQPAGEMVAPNS